MQKAQNPQDIEPVLHLQTPVAAFVDVKFTRRTGIVYSMAACVYPRAATSQDDYSDCLWSCTESFLAAKAECDDDDRSLFQNTFQRSPRIPRIQGMPTALLNWICDNWRAYDQTMQDTVPVYVNTLPGLVWLQAVLAERLYPVQYLNRSTLMADRGVTEVSLKEFSGRGGLCFQHGNHKINPKHAVRLMMAMDRRLQQGLALLPEAID